MIEIASPATPQLSSLLPLVVRPRRRRSADGAAPTSCDRRRRIWSQCQRCTLTSTDQPVKVQRARSFYLSKSDTRTSQIPIDPSAKSSSFRPAISCLGASRTSVVRARGSFCIAGLRETCTGADIQTLNDAFIKDSFLVDHASSEGTQHRRRVSPCRINRT